MRTLKSRRIKILIIALAIFAIIGASLFAFVSSELERISDYIEIKVNRISLTTYADQIYAAVNVTIFNKSPYKIGLSDIDITIEGVKYAVSEFHEVVIESNSATDVSLLFPITGQLAEKVLSRFLSDQDILINIYAKASVTVVIFGIGIPLTIEYKSEVYVPREFISAPSIKRIVNIEWNESAVYLTAEVCNSMNTPIDVTSAALVITSLDGQLISTGTLKPVTIPPLSCKNVTVILREFQNIGKLVGEISTLKVSIKGNIMIGLTSIEVDWSTTVTLDLSFAIGSFGTRIIDFRKIDDYTGVFTFNINARFTVGTPLYIQELPIVKGEFDLYVNDTYFAHGIIENGSKVSIARNWLNTTVKATIKFARTYNESMEMLFNSTFDMEVKNIVVHLDAYGQQIVERIPDLRMFLNTTFVFEMEPCSLKIEGQRIIVDVRLVVLFALNWSVELTKIEGDVYKAEEGEEFWFHLLYNKPVKLEPGKRNVVTLSIVVDDPDAVRKFKDWRTRFGWTSVIVQMPIIIRNLTIEGCVSNVPIFIKLKGDLYFVVKVF